MFIAAGTYARLDQVHSLNDYGKIVFYKFSLSEMSLFFQIMTTIIFISVFVIIVLMFFNEISRLRFMLYLFISKRTSN